jgi:cell division protein FtsI/penicillin-binding protein 2
VFERRLKVLLGLLVVALLIVVGRLAQLQLVEGAHYRRRAEQSLVLRPKQTPFVRGSILDRTGEVLVRDEACWDVTIDYSALAADLEDEPHYMPRVARAYRRSKRLPSTVTVEEVEAAVHREIAAMWRQIGGFAAGAGLASQANPRERAREIYEQVNRIRGAVAQWRGFDAPVAEETVPHAIVTGLNTAEQIKARERFARFPWVHVEPATQRRFAPDATTMAHVLGRTGPVDADRVAEDPNADDPFARYVGNERAGVTGVEYAAEAQLRGRRGQITKDRQGRLIEEESIEAQNGQDVVLSLHAGLQRRLYRLLGERVEATPDSCGGAMVVLDVASREVLALVSYPSYDPNRFDEVYPSLRDDTERLPLRFRAVANRYAPGSTIKPLVCLAGLMGGQITLSTRETCTGYLFEEVRDRWRCWRIHGTSQRKAHGSVDVVEALVGSCNVFMYRLGERIGVDGLCSAFDMVGIGRLSGIGLREEVEGINPTPGWLMANKNLSVTPGLARLYAIGQGEVSATPIQVANLMATYASGRYRHVTLMRSASPTPEWRLPVTAAQLRAIQRGIYGVVNDPDGTAYRYARFVHDRWALCGKTGSASAHPWPTAYRVHYVSADGVDDVALVRAGAKSVALERFAAEYPGAVADENRVEVASRWPPRAAPGGEGHSHAWFGGFLQALDGSGGPDWSRESPIAFAVLVEFGGSGGRTSGPLAQSVAAELLDVLGPTLTVDTDEVARAWP